MRRTTFLLLALAAGCWLPAARADVKPHPLFADHMVLQRGTDVLVFGSAAPGEGVSVGLEGGPAAAPGVVPAAAARADDKGRWLVRLPARPAGTGYTLRVKGDKNEVVVKDVAVGEVWVCGGQSNMQWEFWRLTKDDQGQKVSAAARDPDLRLFTVPRRFSDTPLPTFAPSSQPRGKEHKAEFGKWEPAEPAAVLEFSAVGYYFGRDLRKALNVPVGLIACNWGGTPAEAWTSREALAAVPELRYYITEKLDERLKNYSEAKAEEDYKKALEKYEAAVQKAKGEGSQTPRKPSKPARVDQNTPTALFNGMIYSLLPYRIAGAIWYQGESNAGRAAEYYTLFPTMIRDWRRQWGYDFPFLAVQLAPFRGGASGVDYAELRDAQFQATRVLPRVGIAVITDAGDETDIHPQKKEPAGARLALAARAIAYGEPVVYHGPVYRSLTVTGNTGVVAFDHAAGGLVAKGDAVHGFTVCGEDGKFHPAKAEVRGDTVVVTSDQVEKPVAVRYGWVNFAKPELNLFNQAGLPAVPFRTDNFPLTTAAKK